MAHFLTYRSALSLPLFKQIIYRLMAFNLLQHYMFLELRSKQRNLTLALEILVYKALFGTGVLYGLLLTMHVMLVVIQRVALVFVLYNLIQELAISDKILMSL